MAIDPWAEDAGDEPTGGGRPALSSVESAGNRTRLTFKGGPGYDAPWLVIDADSPRDALALMGMDPQEVDELSEGQVLDALLKRLSRAGYAFSDMRPASAKQSGGARGSAGGGQQERRQAGKPNSATEAPDWMGEAPECDCGQEKVYVSGFSEKTNKTWHAWDCPGNCRGSREFKNKPGSGGGQRGGYRR